MKKSILIICICCFAQLIESRAQTVNVPGNSLFAKLKDKDSLMFYQCHVEEAVIQLTTASGQTLTGQSAKSTITEKFVIKKNGDKYSYTYYTATLAVFPNKKFSGLKIRERPYWNFKRVGEGELGERELKLALGLEQSGREATEFDFPISKYNTNQIILKFGKNFKQLVLDNSYVLSRLIRQAS